MTRRGITKTIRQFVALMFLGLVAVATAFCQTTNESVSVGGGTLSYQVVENTGECGPGGQAGQLYPLYTYQFSHFTYSGPGFGAAVTGVGSTSYLQSPSVQGCPSTGWQGPYPAPITFPGFLVLFSGSPGGSGTATLQYNTTTQTTSTLNPSVYGQSVTLTTLVNDGGGQVGGTVTFEDDYAPIGTASTSLVSSTNLIPYSQSIGNSSWGPYCGSASSITQNVSSPAPDGTLTATSITTPSSFSCGGAGAWGAIGTVAGGLTAGTTYTVSVWLQGNTGDSVIIGLNDCASNPVPVAPNWQRFTMTYPSISSQIANCPGGARGFQVLNPYSTNDTFYVWGAQTEASPSEGPYIQTSAGAASGYGGIATLTTSSLSPGAHSITGIYGETQYNANNINSPLSQTVNKLSPSVSVSCSPNPITYGSQTTTCGATVSGNATGTVALSYNGTSWTTPTLSNGSVSATGFNGIPAGTYNIAAAYSGDTYNYPESASTTLTILKATPSVSVVCSPNPIVYGGGNSTCVATVTAGATGTVSFFANGGAWTTVALSGNTASATGWGGASWAAGSYPVAVTYNGDGNFNPASNSSTITISKASPTVSVSCSPNPITYGTQTTHCTTTVSGGATGTLAWTINGSAWATSTLSGGSASAGGFNGSAAGSYTIVVSYSGDANNNAESGSTTLTISKEVPSVTVSCSPNPFTYYSVTTCTASVSEGATGSVAWTLNGATWTTSTLSSGKATAEGLSGYKVGTYTVLASYQGDTDNSVVSGSTSLTITKANARITWPAPAAIATGTALSSTQLNATSNIAGSFAYSIASGTVLANGTYTITTTFTPTDTTDYNTTTASVSLIVAPAPALSWATPASISYGTALSSAQLNAASSVPGAFAYSYPSGTLLAAGSYTLTATFTPTTSTQSTGGTVSVPLTVYQANPLITWPAPVDITKGTAFSSTQLNATASVAGTMSYSPASGTVLPVGPNTLTATFTPTNTTDYATVTAHSYLTVTDGTTTWDSGTVALLVNRASIATASYAKGSTPASVAAALANAASSSLVSVAAVDNALYLNSKTAGAGSDYTYALQTTSYDSAVFSQPSFAYPALSGSLDGGAAAGSNSGTTVYSYSVPAGGYDGVGNLKQYSDSSAGSTIMGTWTFSYDNLNRLAGATDNQKGNTSTNYCWAYDSFGNRTTQSGSNAAFTTGFSGTPSTSPCTAASSASLVNSWATYSSSNRMLTNSQLVSSVPYDASGNVLNDGVSEYLYDGEGRVCAAANSLTSAMTGYLYDADGLRVAKGTITAWSCDPTVNGFKTLSDFVLGPSGEQVTEMGTSSTGAMAWQHTNVYGAGKLMATYDKDGLHFYLDDPLGSRRAQSDYAGVLEQTCASLPFGDSLNCSGSSVFPTEHHFTGKERDTESGLDYFGARYYASNMGRFMSPDWSVKQEPVPYSKLDDPQSLNLYAYVQNNPLATVDIDGHGCDDPAECRAIRDSVSTGGSIQEGEAAYKTAQAQQQSAPSPLKDNIGNVVNGASGSPALIPGGFDPNAVVKAGTRDNVLGAVSPPLGAAATTADLAKFRRGGSWDLQRLSGNFDPRFIDSATILIGMYAASAGVTRGQILSIENDVARNGRYAAGTPMDSTYTHLPVRNVTNTDIGMRLIQSGAYVP